MKKQKLVTMSAPSVVINGEEEVILEGKFRLCDYSSARVVLDLKYRGKCAVISGESLRLCAAAENVVYAWMNGWDTLLLRSVSSVPAHLLGNTNLHNRNQGRGTSCLYAYRHLCPCAPYLRQRPPSRRGLPHRS